LATGLFVSLFLRLSAGIPGAAGVAQEGS